MSPNLSRLPRGWLHSQTREDRRLITQFATGLAPYLAKFTLTVYIAVTTAYAPETVDPRWGGIARWSGQPPVVGQTVACPVEWARERIYVQGYGVRWCEDTPARGWYGDSPHIDLFLGSRQEALNHGIQELKVWRLTP